MKRLSDYEGEEAIRLWSDLIDVLQNILTNENVRKVVQSGKSRFEIARAILAECPKDAVTLMERIDPEPVNGLNILTRLITLLSELGQNEDIKAFFGYAEQAKMESASGGSPTENTGAKEK